MNECIFRQTVPYGPLYRHNIFRQPVPYGPLYRHNIFRQPVPYGPLYRHNICLLQQQKSLKKLRETSIFYAVFQIVLTVQMQSTAESTASRIPAANILTTSRTIPLFCRELWKQILIFVPVDVGRMDGRIDR